MTSAKLKSSLCCDVMNTLLALIQHCRLSLEQKEGLDTMDVLLHESLDVLEEIMSGEFGAFMQHFYSFFPPLDNCCSSAQPGSLTVILFTIRACVKSSLS